MNCQGTKQLMRLSKNFHITENERAEVVLVITVSRLICIFSEKPYLGSNAKAQMRAIRKSAPAWFWRPETGFKVNFEESWKILYLEGVLKGPRWFLCYLERQGVGKTNESRSRSFLVGRIWIETSLDVYYRVRNEEKKVFKNIEIWWLLPVTVYCAAFRLEIWNRRICVEVY